MHKYISNIIINTFKNPEQCAVMATAADQNLRLPIAGRSGSLISLILCWMFNSLTAETAREGAEASPAYKEIVQEIA